MAATITFTLDTSSQQDLGPMRGAPSGRVRETVIATGSASAANDTGTYVPAYCHKNCQVIDAAAFVSAETDTIGGASLTIQVIPALGSNSVRFTLEGDY